MFTRHCVVLAAACAVAGSAAAASVELQKGTLGATIADSGNFDYSAYPALAYGGREFVNVGTPSSWYWFSAGTTQLVAQYGANPFGASTWAAGPGDATTVGAFGDWSFSQTVHLASGNKLTVHLNLTNTGDSDLDGVRWGVGFDPDQDYGIGTPFTFNRILGQGAGAAVSAYGEQSGLTVTLANDTAAGASAVAYVNAGDCCFAVDPAKALANGQAAGYGRYGDDSISLAYDLGTVAAGQTVSIGYSYSFAPAAIPEPATAAMMLGGLALLAARRRRAAC
ncbi:PEP-CTERM sorting domain-containing protein [Rubrivivax gelatinosus]|uniref:Putative secreted protein with PEP-CTERM sorting signal n=1 Tax=Rubrivivax gelatinosus TaxID=28068 RepID=A0A4R2MB21_RUBGE|nr:PEP-CTERM sorting domain-containing protein [Rubrivivax gelatinosus]MBK1687870.1 hypothetical protein [Rubrivivax gelatinosus]TCP01717.1 putative secreted protein with PEP-CTERM sorting signal [Rubrivivax gelatinosus]